MTLSPGGQQGSAEQVERGIWLASAVDRADFATFVERVLRLDEAAVIRLRTRTSDSVTAWAATGFDVLASRVIGGRVVPADLSAAADVLRYNVGADSGDGWVDPGFAMDSAWRGSLPPDGGFVHVDDIPARVMLELAQRGAELAREHGSSYGPPAALLDQEVVGVSSAQHEVGVPMRCVFALTALGFLPSSPDSVSAEEIVRVRVLPSWLRIDARFGSVYRRRGDPAVVLR